MVGKDIIGSVQERADFFSGYLAAKDSRPRRIVETKHYDAGYSRGTFAGPKESEFIEGMLRSFKGELYHDAETKSC